ncbi:MAG: nucleoside hydrolase, partial [Erysipelotrichaceae bacterium]
MSVKKVIIDTDPGIDDAVALGVAIGSELDIKMISTVSGNVGIEQTTKNADLLLNFWNKNIEITKGAARPLILESREIKNIHGETGLGGYSFDKVERSNTVRQNCIESLRQKINDNPGITLICLGPLTNVAILIKAYPELMSNISEIILMGGSTYYGNETASAEYNILVDPHAAKIIFDSGLNITMVGLDVTNQALLQISWLDDIGNETSKMIKSMFLHYRGGSKNKGFKMHDLCAVLYALHPDIYETQKYYVDIELQSTLCLGRTVVDERGKMNKEENIT